MREITLSTQSAEKSEVFSTLILNFLCSTSDEKKKHEEGGAYILLKK